MSQTFNDYLSKIIVEILKNDNLLKLLFYDTPNALSQPELTDEQKNALVYTRIFPYKFIPNINDSVSSYLNMSFNNFRELPNSPVFTAGKITFFVTTHKDLWRMDGGLRTVFLLEEMKKVGENLNGLGIGRLKFVSSDECWHNNTVGGYYITFEIVDFK